MERISRKMGQEQKVEEMILEICHTLWFYVLCERLAALREWETIKQKFFSLHEDVHWVFDTAYCPVRCVQLVYADRILHNEIVTKMISHKIQRLSRFSANDWIVKVHVLKATTWTLLSDSIIIFCEIRKQTWPKHGSLQSAERLLSNSRDLGLFSGCRHVHLMTKLG